MFTNFANKKTRQAAGHQLVFWSTSFDHQPFTKGIAMVAPELPRIGAMSGKGMIKDDLQFKRPKYQLPFGKHTNNTMEHHHFSWVNDGKWTISMAIFNSKLWVYHRGIVCGDFNWVIHSINLTYCNAGPADSVRGPIWRQSLLWFTESRDCEANI